MLGVHLSKELMAIAGHSLKANITTLGPLVLPVSEQLLFFFNLIGRKVGDASACTPTKIPPPNSCSCCASRACAPTPPTPV